MPPFSNHTAHKGTRARPVCPPAARCGLPGGRQVSPAAAVLPGDAWVSFAFPWRPDADPAFMGIGQPPSNTPSNVPSVGMLTLPVNVQDGLEGSRTWE